MRDQHSHFTRHLKCQVLIPMFNPYSLRRGASHLLRSRLVQFDPQLFLLLPVLVFSVVVHECAHGWIALWWRAAAAGALGRLPLLPFAHLDPIGSLLLPGVLLLLRAPFVIGWAKPVPVDHSRLRDLRNDPMKVALAGPASNLLLALFFAALV